MKSKTTSPRKRTKHVIAGVDLRQVAKEPVEERQELIFALQDQLASDSQVTSTISPELAALLDERLTDAEKNPDDVYTWEEVLAHIHRKRS